MGGEILLTSVICSGMVMIGLGLGFLLIKVTAD